MRCSTRITGVLLFLGALCLGGTTPTHAEDPDPAFGWPHASWRKQRTLEETLLAGPPPAAMREWHDRFCMRPHPAGTKQDQWMINELEGAFEEIGVTVKRQDIWPYLPQFVSAEALVVEEGTPIALLLKEAPLKEDKYTTHPELQPGWNGYSGSGDVIGEVVYANYGTKADFEKLAELGVSCLGKVVIARYGKNYRGYKAKFAEAAGAIGLVMYTDPADTGYGRGITYPEGGWAHESSIQRGSIKTLAYPGDPLTPFKPATKDAERLDPASVPLPRILVQPMGWRSAKEIIGRMRGVAVPKGWQGGLPYAYRLTGGSKLRVRLRIQQKREVTQTANVLGVIEGATHPEQKIVIGCHFDAWTFGAGDPHAGTIILYAVAHAFAEAAKGGMRPNRTLVFANWGAEEMGIIGSTEWCEANRDDLLANGVAYINLDMAAMGTKFRCSADPLLQEVVAAATQLVTQPGGGGKSVYQAWTADSEGKPKFGVLGGGSDHIGFVCHLGVPSMALGAGGSDGVSYNSGHDNLAWYRKVVGDDYAGAQMLAQVCKIVVSRLANAPLIPYGVGAYGEAANEHLDALEKRAGELDFPVDFKDLRESLSGHSAKGRRVQTLLRAAAGSTSFDEGGADAVNKALLQLPRAWLDRNGLPGRPWYRSLFAASDPNSGYAAWMLPLLRESVELRRSAMLTHSRDRYGTALYRLQKSIEALSALVPPDDR